MSLGKQQSFIPVKMMTRGGKSITNPSKCSSLLILVVFMSVLGICNANNATSLSNSTCPNPSWDFYWVTDQPWPAMHTIHPFIITILFEKPVFTLLLIGFSEYGEAWLELSFSTYYYVFVGEADGELEPKYDSLIGDPTQGFIGILLALQLFTVFKYSWRRCCNDPCCVYGCCSSNLRRCLKALLIYIPFLLSTFFFNFRAFGINLGVILVFIMVCVVFLYYNYFYCEYWIVGSWREFSSTKVRIQDSSTHTTQRAPKVTVTHSPNHCPSIDGAINQQYSERSVNTTTKRIKKNDRGFYTASRVRTFFSDGSENNTNTISQKPQSVMPIQNNKQCNSDGLVMKNIDLQTERINRETTRVRVWNDCKTRFRCFVLFAFLNCVIHLSFFFNHFFYSYQCAWIASVICFFLNLSPLIIFGCCWR